MTSEAIGSALVGLRLGPVEHRWSSRDAILYSLGIGARLPQDLAFLYERGGPRVEPTFALTAITPMLPLLVERIGVDLRRLLHAGQRLTVLRQLEPAGTVSVTRTITGVWDKRTAALIECEDTVADDDGTLATAASRWWLAGAGGFGGPADERGAESTGGRGAASTDGRGDKLAGAGAPPALPDRQPNVRTSADQHGAGGPVPAQWGSQPDPHRPRLRL